ncbi:MAG: hypothetical protein ACNA8K_16590, partial [Cyclonatronaceae bacterium]
NIIPALILFLLFPQHTATAQSAGHPVTINITVADDLKESLESKGRLFVFLNRNLAIEPMDQLWPFPGRMSHIFAMNRSGFSPEGSITIDPDAGRHLDG